MLTDEQNKRLLDAAAAAVACELTTQVPAELTVSQWALESGWGSNQPGNNCFGIKARKGDPAQMLDTTEVVDGKPGRYTCAFEAFPDLAACFARHAEVLRAPVYREAWKCSTVSAFTRAVAAHYATAPNYADMLISIQDRPDVAAALAAARRSLAVQPKA